MGSVLVEIAAHVCSGRLSLGEFYKIRGGRLIVEMVNELSIKYITIITFLLCGAASIAVYYGLKSREVELPSKMQLKLAEKLEGKTFEGKLTPKKIPYRLFRPSKARADEKLPLILVLQASGGRGEDNIRQLNESVDLLTSREFQSIGAAFVLAPQCPLKMEWNNSQPSSPPYVNYRMESMETSWREALLIELIEDLIKSENIDKNRIYITGMSMGGTGTWDMLYRFPDFFAAAVPLNGRSDPSIAEVIASVPIWVFHGFSDPVAPITNSREMVKALKVFNEDVKFSELDAGHGIAYQSYTPALYRWLLHQKKH